ncbi:MAG: ComEA family DNA-binding protein [Gemmatales bacterium]|nr:ComEA family DNA-binding protein [Gemmatales bacterium]MDW8386671.1 ComEA family DNA-binding protein [Gemmatales bacterium]
MSAPRLTVASWFRELPGSHRVQLATAFLLGLASAVIVQTAWQTLFEQRTPTVLTSLPESASNRVHPLDLNTATAEELQHLPGVGAGLASRIASHRDKRGGFTDVEDLLDVPGIGPKLLEQLRPHVCIRVNGSSRVPPKAAGSTAKQASPTEEPFNPPTNSPGRPVKLGDSERAVVDLNQAGTEELQRLPGIGPTLAARIVAHRAAEGPFHSVGDLLRVRGIGPKTLEKIRPYVRVGSDFADNRPGKASDAP